MKKAPLFIFIVGLVAGTLWLIYGFSALKPYLKKSPEPVNTPVETLVKPKVDFGNPSRGAKEPILDVVVFSDFECPACASLEQNIGELVDEYGDRVRFVWKDLPNSSIHREALNASLSARCAQSQGFFWEYHDILFANNDSLSITNYPIFAEELGLDTESFRTCLQEKITQPLVERDIEEAVALKIDATPYLFIDDARYSGAISVERLKIILNLALSQLQK